MPNEDSPAPALKRTPFHELHSQAGARMVDFAGWDMPVSYAGILEEHRSVRTSVGVFDVSHMGEFIVEGDNAGEFLDHLLTNRVGDCPIGKAIYSPMCKEDGGVVDDLIVYRRLDGSFLVVVNASNREKDFQWMKGRVGLFDVDLHEESDDWALLAVQGPEAMSTLKNLGMGEVFDLGRFRLVEFEWKGLPLIVSRTGYTGEDGVEIFVPTERALELAKELSVGEKIPWIGLGARDSLRLEAGLPLYGHEMSESITPVQAGFGWAVKTDKPSFIGRDALRMEKELGAEKTVRFFLVDDKRIAREGMPVLDEGGEIGVVLSGSKSPILDCPIGSALVDASFTGDAAWVDSRGKRLPIRFAKPPLHR